MLLWSGQTISTIGSGISGLAFPLLVLGATHSAARAGLVGFAGAISGLLFLPAGVAVDRWNRRRIMVVTDGARAVLLASIAALAALKSLPFAYIVIAALATASLGVFFGLAEMAAVGQVVPQERLSEATAQNQARQQGAGVVSQPLGGFLFSLGTAVPFLFDAISYVASLLSLLFVRGDLQGPRERTSTNVRADIGEGLRFLWNENYLRTTMLLTGGTNVAHAGLGLLLIVRARDLGASPTLIGVMLAIFSSGAIVGSLVGPWVQRTLKPPVVLIGSIWLWAADTACLVLAHSALVLGVLASVQVLAGVCCNVVGFSYLYRLVPDSLIGRVLSASSLIASGVSPLGPLAAGFLIESYGAQDTLLIFALAFFVLAIVATSRREIRAASLNKP
jgi:MFS family permease